jgi:hypothetical protein
VRNMPTSEVKGIHHLGNILCPSGVGVACLGPSQADASSEMLFAAESGRKRSEQQASQALIGKTTRSGDPCKVRRSDRLSNTMKLFPYRCEWYGDTRHCQVDCHCRKTMLDICTHKSRVADINPPPNHFVLEAVQNADDNDDLVETPRLNITYLNDTILITISEKWFTKQNMKSSLFEAQHNHKGLGSSDCSPLWLCTSNGTVESGICTLHRPAKLGESCTASLSRGPGRDLHSSPSICGGRPWIEKHHWLRRLISLGASAIIRVGNPSGTDITTEFDYFWKDR